MVLPFAQKTISYAVTRMNDLKFPLHILTGQNCVIYATMNLEKIKAGTLFSLIREEWRIMASNFHKYYDFLGTYMKSIHQKQRNCNWLAYPWQLSYRQKKCRGNHMHVRRISRKMSVNLWLNIYTDVTYFLFNRNI